MQRRELFSSFVSGLKGNVEAKSELAPIRPPYSGDEALFMSECLNCEGKCATSCEEGIIEILDDKTPSLVFEKSGCTFCDACARACEFGVLTLENKSNINATLDIDVVSCLSWSGVMCFSCKDPCLENAITFQGLFKPVIEESKCTACGFCLSRCPALAIQIRAVA